MRRTLLLPLLLATGALLPVAAAATELDQHGRGHRWEGPSGQLTLLDFAASWCAPCRQTLPRLEAFARRHPGLRVLVVSVDERREGRDELVSSLHLTLPVIWDEDHRIAERYQPAAMPAAVLVSAQGEVLHASRGSRADEWQKLVQRIDSLLGESGRGEDAP